MNSNVRAGSSPAPSTETLVNQLIFKGFLIYYIFFPDTFPI